MESCNTVDIVIVAPCQNNYQSRASFACFICTVDHPATISSVHYVYTASVMRLLKLGNDTDLLCFTHTRSFACSSTYNLRGDHTLYLLSPFHTVRRNPIN